jgi:RNA polymerase sigma-70 factor (ECF subfamily)
MHHQDESTKRMQHSDEYLLDLAIQGDGASFGELVQRWERKIFAFICRYIGNSEEAKDLTQNTFTKAFQHLGRLSEPSRFSAWLYQIALNECRMRFRSQQRSRAVLLEESTARLSRVESDPVTPETRLQSKEQVLRLQEAFARLPREQREVILMKEYQGLRFQDISDVLDIPLSTAKSRMYLGLKTLRRLMGERT